MPMVEVYRCAVILYAMMVSAVCAQVPVVLPCGNVVVDGSVYPSGAVVVMENCTTAQLVMRNITGVDMTIRNVSLLTAFVEGAYIVNTTISIESCTIRTMQSSAMVLDSVSVQLQSVRSASDPNYFGIWLFLGNSSIKNWSFIATDATVNSTLPFIDVRDNTTLSACTVRLASATITGGGNVLQANNASLVNTTFAVEGSTVTAALMLSLSISNVTGLLLRTLNTTMGGSYVAQVVSTSVVKTTSFIVDRSTVTSL